MDTNAILLALLNLVFLYGVAAMLAVDGWVLYRLLTGRRLLPESPLVARRPVPWGGWTILLMFLLSIVLPQAAFIFYAIKNDLVPKPAATAAARKAGDAPANVASANNSLPANSKKPESPQSESHAAEPKTQSINHTVPGQMRSNTPTAEPSEASPSRIGLRMSLTELLALQALSSSLLLVLAPLILRMTSRSPLRDLGLDFHRWWLQLAVGLVAFLAMQPALMATQIAMTKIWENNPHPLLKMVVDEFSPGVPQLAILLAVVVAPIAEEVVFRGVIQSWLVKRMAWIWSAVNSTKSESAISTSPGIPAVVPAEEPAPAGLESQGGKEPPSPSLDAPVLFDPRSARGEFQLDVQFSSPPRPPGAVLAGVIVTSLIFAALHFDQWPAPIALFFLSLAIGYVYERTGSLLAAICMHAAFNALSTALLLISLFLPERMQHPKLEKVQQPAVIAANSTLGAGPCIQVGKR